METPRANELDGGKYANRDYLEHFWLSKSEDFTRALGRRIGENVRGGDFICLTGNLGAGKTLLVKGIASGIGLSENEIVSPSFSLVAEYRLQNATLVHFDVYRLASGADLDDIGFADYLNDGDSILVVEWADRIADCLPEDRLTIEMEYGSAPDERKIEARAYGASSAALLSKLI